MPPTRRDFLAASAAMTAAALLGRPLHLLAWHPAGTAEPVFTPLRRNVGTFTMRGGTVGWLVNPGGVAVVDTQFPVEAQALLAGLQERSGSRGVDVLLNTHHHGDHTGGNGVFRGVARRVVAHGMADQHMRRAPQPAQQAQTQQQPSPPQQTQPPAPAPLYPDTTFTHVWSADVGDERIVARHHGRAHTSGDAAITFERANVVHMRRAPQPPQQAQQGQQPPPQPQPQQTQPPPPAPLYPDTTFTHAWSADVGDERIVARHHGRAHTSGDAVITFERANVVHMGDLVFHRRHPVVDRAAGASMRNWMRALEQVVNAHAPDTIYVFGHAGEGLPVTGSSAELLQFRDYLGAVLAFVEGHVAAGRSREEILAMRAPLAGFEAWGPFGQAGAREPLTVAYEEVTTGA